MRVRVRLRRGARHAAARSQPSRAAELGAKRTAVAVGGVAGPCRRGGRVEEDMDRPSAPSALHATRESGLPAGAWGQHARSCTKASGREGARGVARGRPEDPFGQGDYSTPPNVPLKAPQGAPSPRAPPGPQAGPSPISSESTVRALSSIAEGAPCGVTYTCTKRPRAAAACSPGPSVPGAASLPSKKPTSYVTLDVPSLATRRPTSTAAGKLMGRR
mmetsp:Transcript_13925/g.47116  ORF Transcript_13925/g.47116 Transcript_13925/m.47116 type:complete len:217 (+) Transcript_13925:241-891(+)